MDNLFRVSVKGVLKVNHKYLLRKNERDEWELIGGKLETGDKSIKSRLKTEFREEAGLRVKVDGHLEPWVYKIGDRRILILPYITEIMSSRKKKSLQNEELGWFINKELDSLNLPDGYMHSIRQTVPFGSYSYLKGGEAGFPDSMFKVYVVIKDINRKTRVLLENHQNPREIAEGVIREKSLSGVKLISEPSTRYKNNIFINYRIFR